jgi:hypothetical protein
MKNAVLWDVTLCGSCKNRHFGGRYHLHRHGDKNEDGFLHNYCRENLKSYIVMRQFEEHVGYTNPVTKDQFKNLSPPMLISVSKNLKTGMTESKDISSHQDLPMHRPELILLPDSVAEFSVP